MDGVEGAVEVVPEGFEDTADCSVDFESRPLLLVVVVSIDSTNVTATAACECDSVSLEELAFVLHTLLDWVRVSDGMGTESTDAAVVDWESDLLSVDWEPDFNVPSSSSLAALSSSAATANRMNPSHTRAR